MTQIAPEAAPLLRDDSVLRPGDAVAAILVDPTGRYLLQLRDRKRGIFYPDHWGCFGGACEADDDNDVSTLRRELLEELSVDLALFDFSFFSRYTFDMTVCGSGVIYRSFYEAKLTANQIDSIKLHEGQRFELFEGWDAMERLRLVPYDAFAIWMHVNRNRVAASVP